MPSSWALQKVLLVPRLRRRCFRQPCRKPRINLPAKTLLEALLSEHLPELASLEQLGPASCPLQQRQLQRQHASVLLLYAGLRLAALKLYAASQQLAFSSLRHRDVVSVRPLPVELVHRRLLGPSSCPIRQFAVASFQQQYVSVLLPHAWLWLVALQLAFSFLRPRGVPVRPLPVELLRQRRLWP